MKAAVLADSRPADKGWLTVTAELVKARLTSLVLITTGVGFVMGATGGFQFGLLFHTLAGTALVAGAAATLNQWMERDRDALMRRTRDRPLPAGRIKPEAALAIGLGAAAFGLWYLLAWVGLLTASVGGVTLLSYLLLYTPLKVITPWNTLVGAVPGALPPLMGWSAAHNSLAAGGWCLFAILACWQLPHFMAIAWIYREDYARAGYRMLSVSDPNGRRTAGQALGYAILLLPLSLGPYFLGLVHDLYLPVALLLGAGFVVQAYRFWRRVELASARGLFLVSIGYLPALLILLLVTKN